MTAEWRTTGEVDAVLLLDDQHGVAAAQLANAELLSEFLTGRGQMASWRGAAVDAAHREPAAWGKLVIARADSGEVLDMEPGLFWEGIYVWFRSRGVDYDTGRDG